MLHVSNVDLAVPEGSVEHVLGLAQGLRELGHEPVVLAPSSGQPAKRGDFEVQNAASDPSALARAQAIRGTIRACVEDVAPDALYLRSFPLDYWFVLRMLRGIEVPVVAELNTMAREQHRVLGHRLRTPILAGFEAATLRAVDGWAPVTNEIAEYARQLAGTTKPARVALNAFDVADIPERHERDAIRARYGVMSSDTVMVMAGFGHPWHGVDRAIRAMSLLDESHHLWLAGAARPTDIEMVDDLAAGPLRSRIRVFESMPYGDLIHLFAAGDVGFSSLAFDRHVLTEAQPLKVALYVALGMPVIVSYRDIRFPTNSPLVVRMESDTPAGVVDALDRLKPVTPSLRRQAMDFAAHNLSWQAAARRTVELIDELRAVHVNGSSKVK